MKEQSDLLIDTQVIEQRLRDTNVLSMKPKEFKKWNWTLIHEIVEGPLKGSHNLRVAIKSNFIDRLIEFYMPSNNYFALCDARYSDYTN